MKIKTLFKIFLGVGIVTSVGLTIGLFSQLIPKTYSDVKILTKEVYQNWNNNKKTKLNYASLPTSNYSFRDIMDNPKSVNNGNFMFFIGSQAYKSTNNMLWGINEDFAFSQGKTPNYTNSIMHKLYDAFWGENAAKLGLDKINPIFLNYVDIVEQKAIFDAWDLKIYRESQLGNYETNEILKDSSGLPIKDSATGNYVYKIDKFKWSVGEGRDIKAVPVVKGIESINSDGFSDYNFEPNPTTYYEWRPDDGEDTEYQKVYYRNTPDVINFLSNYSFIEQYTSSNYSSAGTLSKEGTLFCFRNLDADLYEASIDNPFDVKIFSGLNTKTDINNAYDSIIQFYNPDYTDSYNSSSTTSVTKTKKNNQQIKNYNFNQITSEKNLFEQDKNISIIKIKESV